MKVIKMEFELLIHLRAWSKVKKKKKNAISNG